VALNLNTSFPNYFPQVLLQDAVQRVLRGNRGSVIKFVKNKMIAMPGAQTHNCQDLAQQSLYKEKTL